LLKTTIEISATKYCVNLKSIRLFAQPMEHYNGNQFGISHHSPPTPKHRSLLMQAGWFLVVFTLL